MWGVYEWNMFMEVKGLMEERPKDYFNLRKKNINLDDEKKQWKKSPKIAWSKKSSKSS